ncbi:uncharacterized protein LOC128180608 [Crassostrea angulata]|uniref:uncharacterized protein LOC128180608 n=1 Tax=Magallana angulata TaxID=2784310 RepID=UPI0022B0B180|nr:uncharacterized protein LOC128180608 [Crassostrea angulata]
MNTLEADDYCRLTTGGRLAPYIDSLQYNHLLSLRPVDAKDTFIGTNHIALEDTWVNFDGTPIHNNGFIYTMTNYPVDQPNGGTGQNCAVINAKPGDATYIPSETQDKSCTTHSSTDMLCYNEGKPFQLYESRGDECMIGVRIAREISSSPSSYKDASIMDEYGDAGISSEV